MFSNKHAIWVKNIEIEKRSEGCKKRLRKYLGLIESNYLVMYKSFTFQ